MTNEEFERLKESIKAQLENSSPPRVLLKETAESRKLNRDMDRLERVLKKIVSAPRGDKSRPINDGLNPRRLTSSGRAEIREIRERSDAKLRALMEELHAKDKPPQS